MATAVAVVPNTHSPVQQAGEEIRNIEAHLANWFIGREQEIRASLVGLIARRNVIFLSPPGMAKSALIQEIANCLGKKFFYRPLSPTTEYDDLFGPLTIQGIKQDRRVRRDENYLPKAQIGFIDEVFRGSGSIRDALLRIMNEGTYDVDGVDTPSNLEILFSASNEGPRGHHDDAFWDRFALRLKLREVGDDDEFLRLLSLEEITDRPQLSAEALEILREAARSAYVPQGILTTLNNLRKELRNKGIVPSERRWIWGRGILKAHAAFRGASEVAEEDLRILAHLLWQQPEEIPVVRHLVDRCVDALGEAAGSLLEQARAILAEVLKKRSDEDQVGAMQSAVEGSNKLKKIEEKLAAMVSQGQAEQRNTVAASAAIKEIAGMRQTMIAEVLK